MFVKEQHWKLLHFHYLSSSTGKSESINLSFIYYTFKKSASEESAWRFYIPSFFEC